jgi:hypothetical protein
MIAFQVFYGERLPLRLTVMHLLVDGNNVMGSRPDGWWRDRRAGMQRLVTSDAELVRRVTEKGADVIGAKALLELL